jgi:hypothetical protein
MRTHATSRRWAVTLGATALVAALGAPAALASDCDPVVSHSPTGSQGDPAAVAITSQALAADVAGWERVGWQAAPDTTVTAVTLVREDGIEHRTGGDLSEGAAEHVLEVRFCATAHDAEAEATGEAEVAPVSAAAEELAPEPAETEGHGADARPAPTRSGAEHESHGPQRVERGDDTGTHDPIVDQATLAAAVQEPAAPLTGGAVGLLAGLVVVAGATRHRTKEERR